MKRLFILALILCASCGFAQEQNHWTDSSGYPRPNGYNWPLPTQVDAGNGFTTIATPSLDVGPMVAVHIGVIPLGTKVLYVTAFNGAVIMNNQAQLSSGTIYTGYQIASGAVVAITGLDPATTTHNIYLLANTTATSTVRLVGWGN